MPISGHSAWLINTNPAVVDHDGVGLDRNLTWKGLCRSSADVERATMKRTFDDAAILIPLGQHGVSMGARIVGDVDRSEEHTSELQSLMRISYAVFCLKKKIK